MSEKLLIGHTSAATAFVQPDYPYGRELRCKRRVWIENKPRLGQRFVYQTSNPKVDGEKWNKPHAGVYHTICVMYLDETNGHVEIEALGIHSPPHVVDAFVARFGEAALMADPWIAKTLPVIRKLSEARRKREAEQANK